MKKEEQQLANKLHRLEKMRRDFVGNVSHELRTPLTVIIGYVESLLEKNQIEPAELKNILSQMYQQSIRMGTLIDDLLLLSRLENEDEDISHTLVHVAPMLIEICEDAKAIAPNANHQFHFNLDTALTIEGNQDELHSLFSNLIINAVKYTPAQGEITLNWHLKNKHACFEVRDTGIGIDAQDIPRLTERFYRVDKARSRQSGGTGLGLAIVKHVLIRHHGELHVESELGKGSLFRCEFPQ